MIPRLALNGKKLTGQAAPLKRMASWMASHLDSIDRRHIRPTRCITPCFVLFDLLTLCIRRGHNVDVKKYFNRRHVLFSLYDDGVVLDRGQSPRWTLCAELLNFTHRILVLSHP